MKLSGKYPAVARITFLSSLVYGRDLALRLAQMLVVLFVFVQLWSFTFDNRGGAAVSGFDLRAMVWYLVLTETVVLSAPRVSLTIDEDVKAGELAYVLTKPHNYVLFRLAAYWGEAALRLPANFAIGAALALATVGTPDLSIGGACSALIAVALALTINFLIEASIGLSAFWVEESQPFFWIYQKLTFTIGGLFLPVDFLPHALAAVAALLPFAAVTYAPGRLLVAFSWHDLALRLGLQLVWLLAMAAILALVYGRAMRRVSVNGG